MSQKNPYSYTANTPELRRIKLDRACWDFDRWSLYVTNNIKDPAVRERFIVESSLVTLRWEEAADRAGLKLSISARPLTSTIEQLVRDLYRLDDEAFNVRYKELSGRKPRHTTHTTRTRLIGQAIRVHLNPRTREIAKACRQFRDSYDPRTRQTEPGHGPAFDIRACWLSRDVYLGELTRQISREVSPKSFGRKYL